MNYKALYEKLKELIEHVGGIDLKGCNICEQMMKEISALESQSEESYPMEFVEWYVVGDHFCKRTFDYEDLKQWNTLEEVFEYWQSKVKNEKI
jgi:hypothetical protein